MERREHERKKNQKLEFTPGAVQPGNVLPTSKINIPTPGTCFTLQPITPSNSIQWLRFLYEPMIFLELLVLSSAGLAAVSSGVLNLPPASSDAMARDGRQNKKSKWDKVHFITNDLHLSRELRG